MPSNLKSSFSSKSSIFVRFSCALLLLTGACAGPSTPFGAVRGWWPKSQTIRALKRALSVGSSDVKITFTPERQVLHAVLPWTVTVLDPSGQSKEQALKIYYNDEDVTAEFNAQSRSTTNGRDTQTSYVFSRLSLEPSEDHRITVALLNNGKETKSVAEYQAPSCAMFGGLPIKTTQPFSPPQDWIDSVERLSKLSKISAGFLSGLIAQESAFNSFALSSSRALGLTQVTPAADREIASLHPEWPRSEKVENLPYPILKALVASRQLSGNEDWRLDPQLSIEGGAAYLNFLENYWKLKAKTVSLREAGDAELQPALVLASYHSGASRVLKALQTYGPDFINAPELKAAKRYVRRVSSYCSYFTNEAG